MSRWLCGAAGDYLCRAFYPEYLSGWAQALFALVALFVAALAFLDSRRAAAASYRPLLRPVAAHQGDGGIVEWILIVKNFGAGPAMSVMVFNAYQGQETNDPLSPTGTDAMLNESVDVIEPLGPPGDNLEDQPGRRVLKLRRYLEENREYRLIYQDKDGRFFETRFLYHETDVWKVRYVGQVDPSDVPFAARAFAIIKPRRW
jgi:hypothetical protein